MKKLFLTLIAAYLFVFFAKAQDAQGTQDTKNTIKLNVLALLFTNISIQDEYTLNGNSSICLGVSYLPERKFWSSALDATAKEKVEDVIVGGFSITPEYRYYFKGNGPKGLYLSGYFRYAKYTTPESDYKYLDSDDDLWKNVKVTGDYTSAVVGIMLGSQWLLGDKFTLDWWIIGAGFGSQVGTYTGKGVFDANDQQNIKDSAAEGGIGGVDIKVTTSSTQVDLEIDNNLPAIRAFGLCIGYRF